MQLCRPIKCTVHRTVNVLNIADCTKMTGCENYTSGQRILTKGQNTSCHYWGLNDPSCCMPLLTNKWSLLLHTPQQGLPILFTWPDNPVGGSWKPSNIWSLWPTKVGHPNHIWIDSAILAGLSNVTDRNTDSYSICSYRMHLVIAAMQPKLMQSNYNSTLIINLVI